MHQPLETVSDNSSALRRLAGVFGYSRRAIELVWTTNRRVAVLLAAATLVAGILPAAAAYAGKLIVDAVVAGLEVSKAGGTPDFIPAVRYVALEALIVVAIAAAARLILICESLLRAQLGQRVNEMVLEKALSLRLRDFEDSEFYDKLTRARRQASSRPLSLVTKTFGLVQNGISLTSYAVLLSQFSGWAVLILIGAGIPAFVAEARFSGEKRFGCFVGNRPKRASRCTSKPCSRARTTPKKSRSTSLGRGCCSAATATFLQDALCRGPPADAQARCLGGSCSGWGALARSTAPMPGSRLPRCAARSTLGQMTMYLLLFRQGQSAVSASLSAIGKMYEDNLYLSNLYEYLEQPTVERSGSHLDGTIEGDGVRFENVSFTYPGADEPAVEDVSLRMRPGDVVALVGENGSGKTTLVKLLAGLYAPSEGRILLHGRDLQEWDEEALQRHIGVIFQDFSRYQFLAGENVGAGDGRYFDEEDRWRTAATKGMAAPFLEELPKAYHTQLGRWFADGRELSGGQWQKVALSRAFMRSEADIFVLDEPTAALDAEAESQVFEPRAQTRARQDDRSDLASILDGPHGRLHRGAAPGPDRRAG